MATEIERKFLVHGDAWRTRDPIRISQGYLCRAKERTVRVRIAGDRAWITIKGITTGASRPEYEYEIPIADANELLRLCEGPLIEKLRHVIVHEGMTWEIDEFRGDNEGLIVAEVELDDEAESFARPSWLGEEVTDDPRYFNANLSVRPFTTW